MLSCELGHTGLRVTKVGFGTGELRGEGAYHGRPITPDEAGRVLNAVLDAGVTFIDTSPDYGQAEDVIGQYASHRRDEYVLTTKFGCVHERAMDHDANHLWTPENFRRNLERSLKRLRTDHIDLWQLHTPVSVEQICQDDVQAVAEEARAAGKIRAIGVSADRRTIDGFLPWTIYETLQTSYSLLERRDERVLVDLKRRGIGTIVRGSLAQGDPSAGGKGSIKKWQLWHDAKLDELLPPGESRTAFLLRYALATTTIDTVIIGMGYESQVAENLKAVGLGPLPLALYEEARRRIDAVAVVEMATKPA